MAEETEAKKRHRSPSYPACGLPEAIERLKAFYRDQKRATVHLNAAYESLGYKTGSSNGARVVAALISYGFLLDEGTGPTRKVRLSESGMKVCVLETDDPKWKAEIHEAATRPKLYADLLETWPDGLPSDKAIENHLLLELNFNSEAVPGLIRDFRATYDFAELGNGATLPEGEGSKGKGGRDDSSVSSGAPGNNGRRNPSEDVRRDNPPPVFSIPEAPKGMRTHTIPIPGDRQAILHVPSPLSEGDFTFLQKYLQLMGDAIVSQPVAPLVRNGGAIWRATDADHPVNVLGYFGEQSGRHYVRIEGSGSGVPLDELVYDE